MSLGSLVREKRKALGLTQKELAERISVSAANVSHIETGTRGVSAPTLNRLCSVLGLDAALALHLSSLATT